MPKKDRTWYEMLGVEEPSHEPHITEEKLEEIFDKMRDKTKHGLWKQQGNAITCNRCPNPHSSTIPVEYLLMGTAPNGEPLLRKVS